MAKVFDILSELCAQRGISGYKMSKDLGMQPSIMTDLKMGRRSGFSAETATKIANYFDVSVDYLLGKEQKNSTPEEVEQDKQFFRLRDGLSQYNLTDSDVDYILASFKLYKSHTVK